MPLNRINREKCMPADTKSNHKSSNAGKVLACVLQEFAASPVDLLAIGDVEDERAYLSNAYRSYRRTINDLVALFPQSTISEKENIKVLEIGAYLGVVSTVLARLNFSVTALDIPEFMNNIDLQRRYEDAGVEYLSANLRDYAIPSEAGKFDLVIMCETLEHLNFNPIPVLLEINRILKTGGKLYLSLPNLASLVNRAKLLLGRSIHNPVSDFIHQLGDDRNMLVGLHWREYTRSELFELVQAVGFSVDKFYYFTSHRPSLPASLIYHIFPSSRSNLTLWATKKDSKMGQFDCRRFIKYNKGL